MKPNRISKLASGDGQASVVTKMFEQWPSKFRPVRFWSAYFELEEFPFSTRLLNLHLIPIVNKGSYMPFPRLTIGVFIESRCRWVGRSRRCVAPTKNSLPILATIRTGIDGPIGFHVALWPPSSWESIISSASVSVTAVDERTVMLPTVPADGASHAINLTIHWRLLLLLRGKSKKGNRSSKRDEDVAGVGATLRVIKCR